MRLKLKFCVSVLAVSLYLFLIGLYRQTQQHVTLTRELEPVPVVAPARHVTVAGVARDYPHDPSQTALIVIDEMIFNLSDPNEFVIDPNGAEHSVKIYRRRDYSNMAHGKGYRHSADAGRYTGELPTFAIFLTYWRSGSTFLAAWFENYEVSYVFEPFHSLGMYHEHPPPPFIGELTPAQTLELKQTFAEDMSNCQFRNPVMDTVGFGTTFIRQIKRKTAVKSCDTLTDLGMNCTVTKSDCFKASIRAENQTVDKETAAVLNYCNVRTDRDVAREICLSNRLTMFKTIRIENINDYREVLTRTRALVRVVHLVRDPRGSAWSRGRLLGVEENCGSAIINSHGGLIGPRWLSDNGGFKLVRYEDMAREPYNTLRDVSNFVGLTVNATALEGWVADHTKVDEAEEAMQIRHNSTFRALRWRLQASFEFIDSVQKIPRCAEMMRMYGYAPVRDLEQMKDMSFRTTLDLPRQ